MAACAALAVLASASGSGSTVLSTAPDSLELELVLPGRLQTGQPVSIMLQVRNRTTRALDLYLRGRVPTFDVVIARRGGDVVWRRLEDEIVPAILQLRTLGPSERLELETVWDQRTTLGKPAEPGEYTARGLLLVEGDPLETPAVPFRIVDR
ncbi:hypothetical protein BH24GEM1_BH24GEM1_00540 [soil metagenome]